MNGSVGGRGPWGKTGQLDGIVGVIMGLTVGIGITDTGRGTVSEIGNAIGRG